MMITYYDHEDFESVFAFMYLCVLEYAKEEYNLPLLNC